MEIVISPRRYVVSLNWTISIICRAHDISKTDTTSCPTLLNSKCLKNQNLVYRKKKIHCCLCNWNEDAKNFTHNKNKRKQEKCHVEDEFSGHILNYCCLLQSKICWPTSIDKAIMCLNWAQIKNKEIKLTSSGKNYYWSRKAGSEGRRELGF